MNPESLTEEQLKPYERAYCAKRAERVQREQVERARAQRKKEAEERGALYQRVADSVDFDAGKTVIVERVIDALLEEDDVWVEWPWS